MSEPVSEFEWLHFGARLETEAPEVARQLDILDELTREILLAEEVRPRFLEREHGAILIITTISETSVGEGTLESLRLWISPQRLVSISTTEQITSLLQPLRAAMTEGRYASTIALLVDIIEMFNLRLGAEIDALEDGLDRAESIVATRELNDACLNLGSLRVQTADFRRYLMPQTVALQKLINCHSGGLSADDRLRLTEAHDSSLRSVETLNDIRDRAIIINDEIENLRDRQLNRRTYAFTIIATIFLPLSFLTGLLGVNIGGIPATNMDSAFWIFTFVCCVLIAIQVYIFRRLGLF